MKATVKLIMLVAALTTAGVAKTEAALITWHWAGPVTGYIGGGIGPTLDTAVPLGTPVDVFVSLDPNATFLNPGMCLQGTATASLQVLGRTYASSGFVWVDGSGFGSGLCSSGPLVEVVVPGWGGPDALPGGWVPFGGDPSFLPGLWWGGDLTSQPASMQSQFPLFYIPGQSLPQRFTANLQAVQQDLQSVPEPSTLLLLSTGLAAAAWRRRRQ